MCHAGKISPFDQQRDGTIACQSRLCFAVSANMMACQSSAPLSIRRICAALTPSRCHSVFDASTSRAASHSQLKNRRKQGFMKREFSFLGLMLASIITFAQEVTPVDIDVPQVVEVAGVKNPELKSYRRMLKGVDAFEEHRNYAPAATMKFKLVPAVAGETIEGSRCVLWGITLQKAFLLSGMALSFYSAFKPRSTTRPTLSAARKKHDTLARRYPFARCSCQRTPLGRPAYGV